MLIALEVDSKFGDSGEVGLLWTISVGAGKRCEALIIYLFPLWGNMKLKEGSVVEVCRREEGPLGSWFNARIVSGDGQRYMVEYENFLKVDRKPVIEQVHSEAVRPVPCGRSEAWKWASGDTVEVYDRHSWKVGKVVKALPSNFFVVRLLEPLQQRTCHQSNIRPRLFWQGSGWVPIQQAIRNQKVAGSGFLSDTAPWVPSVATFPQELHAGVQLQDINVKLNTANWKDREIQAVSHVHESPNASVHLNASKRKSGLPSQSAHDGAFLETEAAIQNKRKIQKLCRHQVAVAELALPVLEKVDTVPFPRKCMGEECVCMSLIKDGLKGSSEVEQEKTKVYEQQLATRFRDTVQAESSQCSVASSSSYMQNDMSHSDEKRPTQLVVGSPFDDAQSSCECGNGRRAKFFSSEEVAAKVHKLELYALRAAVRAFYASGPLNWEQEALLTNLRLSLHISNDEYLLELRHLSSAQAV